MYAYPRSDLEAATHVRQVFDSITLDRHNDAKTIKEQIQDAKLQLSEAIKKIGLLQKTQRDSEQLVHNGVMTWNDHISNAYKTDWDNTMIRDEVVLKLWPLLVSLAPASRDVMQKIVCWMGLRQLDAERHDHHVAFWKKYSTDDVAKGEEMIEKARKQLFIQYTRYSQMSFQKLKDFFDRLE